MLDFDDPEDPAHGQQEQVRYDGYDGGYCFLPLHVYAGLSGRLMPTLFKAKRFSAAQLLAVLKRLVKHLRQAWPDTLIVCRGDSHFASPEVMEWIESQAHLRYVTGLTCNAVLKTLAHAVGGQAKRACILHLAGPLEACTERLAAQEEAGINMHSVRVEASDAKTAGKLYAKLVG